MVSLSCCWSGTSQEKGTSYPIAEYRQRFEQSEQAFRETLSEPEKLPTDDPLTLVVSCLMKPYVEKSLAHLSWIERSCLLLHIDAQFTPAEIAEIMSMEEEDIHVHLENGKKLLLQTYALLLEKEQSIPPSRVPISAQGDSMRVDWLKLRTQILG